MKKIGQGAFTTAYLQDDGQVLLKSRCPIKEAMALGFFPDSPLFPKIKMLRRVADPYTEYLMEYLPRPSSLKQNLHVDQWKIYKDLQTLESVIFKSGSRCFFSDCDCLNMWREKFETLKNEELREVMIEALEGCGNYGPDISFEISPRNVSVKKGKLILLDCFYQISKL